MLEMNKNVKPIHKGEKDAREKIIKLGKKITDVAGHKLGKVTVDDPEYWGLAEIITDEMADVALKMKLRTPYTFKEMVKLTKCEDEEKLQKLLDEMSYVGLLEYDYGYHYDHNGRTAPQSERRYILPMFVPGSAELFNMDEVTHEDGSMSNPRLEEHPALAGFFERMTYIPLKGLTQLVPPGGAGIGMHVIPVEKAIEAENTSIDIEHLSYWLKKYEGHIGVGQCSCRAACAAYGEGVADDQFNWCIGVGDFADYCRETGKGHDISYEEAMRILKIAEDNGYVHQITNIDGENKIFGICNCNVNVCYALRTSQLFNTPNLSRSAYTAKVNPKNCVACGKCVEYCPAGAVKLGQKLCTKNGEIQYPKHELPTILNWGEDKYDENYRDNNRINCYDTGTAPCKTACPAHIAVQGYLKLASQGKFQEALALIKKDNPLPAICGRICNKRCEEACTRGTVDQPVAIDDVKKYIADLDLNAETRYIPEVVISSNRLDHWDHKIAIIGSGPAGLSCAYYLATKGYKPTVFEKNEKLGGMLTYGIPAYKLEKDVIEAEIDVIRALGVEFKTNCEVGKDITLSELREQGYAAFYLALGCQGSRKANIPGEEGEGVDYAVSFLHDVADKGNMLSGKKVAVVGGGNVAMDCARSAVRLGAKEVGMYVLESRETMPALEEEINEALAENITINNCWGPKEIVRNEDGSIKTFVVKECVSTIGEGGRFSPTYSDKTMDIEADYIIFAIGQTVDWGNILEGEQMEF
ncbi:MAG: FAD-dependent oxidoreductase, partial [Erysipelotrichaceae bacterium]|nr:FAD-dependent oxidoreductase [Erysipelotrichaceae bacterium]